MSRIEDEGDKLDPYEPFDDNAPAAVTVPLPGNAHPAFTDEFIDTFQHREVGVDGTIKIVDLGTGRIAVFKPAQIVMPFKWIVWLDESGRAIAQPAGTFALEGFRDEYLTQPPAFKSGAYISVPVRGEQ